MANKFTTNPHVFDGLDFPYWCQKTQSYIMAKDYDIWKNVANTYEIPDEINTVAHNILFNGIPHSDSNRVSHIQTAHEIWIALKNFHQGTSCIKELRKEVFKKDYIEFEMKPGEALDDYLARFNKVSSNLRFFIHLVILITHNLKFLVTF